MVDKSFLEINHQKLARQVGIDMPECRVLMFESSSLEKKMTKKNPLCHLDMPPKVLLHNRDGRRLISYHTSDYLSYRYSVKSDEYDSFVSSLVKKYPTYEPNQVEITKKDNKGIITIPSSYDYIKTYGMVLKIISSQSDTVLFKVREFDNDTVPCKVIYFGGPEPGGLAMREDTLLGLDVFCQKILITLKGTKVNVHFNDLTWLANVQGCKNPTSLDVVNQRLYSTFYKAFK